MGRRDILTEEDRRALFGVPADRDAMVKLYTLSRADLDLVQARCSNANRLGFAVQLALLRMAPAEIEAAASFGTPESQPWPTRSGAK